MSKKEFKEELERRLQWIEKSYGFPPVTILDDLKGKPDRVLVMYGRYRILLDIVYQIESGLFMGGYVC